MKQVVILLGLLLAVMVNGCGNSKAVEAPSGSIWQAVMSGGTGTSSGFSFNAQFTVSSGGVLSFSTGTFQLLNQDTCLAIFPRTPSPPPEPSRRPTIPPTR